MSTDEIAEVLAALRIRLERLSLLIEQQRLRIEAQRKRVGTYPRLTSRSGRPEADESSPPQIVT